MPLPSGTGIPSLWCTPLGKLRPDLKELALFGVLGGLIFAAKVVMAPLPNIEPVSLLVMLCAVSFGRKALYPICVYVLLEFSLYGFGLWSVCYLYVWPLLALCARALRGMESSLGWALLSGAFGLLFGALCAPVCLLTGGWAFALSWWVSGIPFDLLHCAGNFALALVLFKPLRRVMGRLYGKI